VYIFPIEFLNVEDFKQLSHYRIEVPYVDGMNDLELQAKVNDTLQYAVLSLIRDEAPVTTSRLPNAIAFSYHSPYYLSISSFLPNRDGRFFFEWGIYDFITIDMQTGERIFLNDLIDVNEEFIRLLREGRIAQTEPTEISNNEVMWKWLLDMSEEEIERLALRNFFLSPGKLELRLGRMEMYIHLEDIRDFLKVEPW